LDIIKTKDKSKSNCFDWTELSIGKLDTLYMVLVQKDTNQGISGTGHPLIHDMRCALRNFFYKQDKTTYDRYENPQPKAGVEMCACGFPQSHPIPHEHDQTDREKAIIAHYESINEDLRGALQFFIYQLDPWIKLGPKLKQWTEFARESGEKALAKAGGGMSTVELIATIRQSDLSPKAKAGILEILENWAEENL